MQEFLNWTLKAIRDDNLVNASWLEEKKFEWTPMVAKSITNIINNGCSVIILSDTDRKWFLEYIISNINSSKNARPFLPFYDFKSFSKQIKSIQSERDADNIKDMLNISFPNGYIFWYIGKGQDPIATIAKISKNSFMWLIDENRQNTFSLKSDDFLDYKLLQMFKLFNKTLSAALFAQIDVNK